MRDNDPLGFEVRYRASRAPIPCGVLTARGLNHEGSADRHEKFSSMALQMIHVDDDTKASASKESESGMFIYATIHA